MYFLDLVDFVVPGEECEEREHFEEHAADAPHIHFVVVVAIGEQTLGRAVPARRDIFLRGESGAL